MIAVAVIALLIGIVAGWMITGSVVQPIRQAVALAEGVAAGDLTQKIETDRNDETGQLIKALRSMNDGLLQIVGDIRTSVETINTASQEIAAGNIDLSQRTEEQAASLEETAASMEELTSTVKQNAENAREANRLAEGASGIAQKGGEAVGQVVTTMAEINESSKKIVDIIGVIDGIAFQTNILALNAAVEAARAGEQGRGFAVVAGEVRSLAQRSAAAAKEIKSLIGDSVERVTVGTAQVDRAGITMEEVVGSIRKVTGIMGDISNASAEQSSGIEQVNTAVTQMDEVTQQNAALVEEAAAAAGSLQDQARLLMEAVNRFKLDDVRSVRSSPAPRHVASRPATKAVGHKPVAKSAHPAVAKAAQPVAAGKHDDEDWSEF
ncbi:methyl-accepting chemotaxis protein [Chitinimonas viridis]